MAKKSKVNAKVLVSDVVGVTAIFALLLLIFIPNEILRPVSSLITIVQAELDDDDDSLSINSDLDTSETSMSENTLSNNNNNNTTAVSVQHQKTIRDGVIFSAQDPLQGHEGHQVAVILPPLNDSSVYSGILTFTATKPVEVQVYHHISNIGNITHLTEQSGQILTSPFGNGRIVISLIKPEYGEAGQFSGSLPFAGKALALHTSSREPFFAAYTVDAEIDQVKEAPRGELVGTQTGITDYVGLPDFIALLLTGVLTPEQIAMLPLSDLGTEDLVKIFDSLSTKDLTRMLNTISPDEVDNLLTKLPVDKGREIKAIMETKNMSKS
jgi:hypothetical protein